MLNTFIVFNHNACRAYPLGTTLTVLVGAYTQRQTTDLLMENVESIANSVSSNLLVADMNDNYSDEKEMICRALKIISNSVDADIFVCDTEGNIILAKKGQIRFRFSVNSVTARITPIII